MSDDPIYRSVGALGAYFVGDSTVAEALDKICHAALEAVDPAVLVAVSMSVDARVGTYVFTHPEAVEIDQPQYDTGEGPCEESFRTGEVVVVRDTREPGPYAAFRQEAQAHGVLSVASTPMSTGDTVVGALNMYAPRVDAFDSRSLELARAFSTHAAFVLLNHQAYWDARSLNDNLTQAMKSRAEIEQAKGIIIGSTGCTPDEAFARLREQSQREHVKLRDIAAEIVRNAQHRS